jgi:hypothetical protein
MRRGNNYSGPRWAFSSTQPRAPRKRTVFEPCPKHEPGYASETRYRRAELMGEGGIANSPCEGGRCRMKPGTDLMDAGWAAAHPVYYVGDPL